jgi:CHAD domain-containing protein
MATTQRTDGTVSNDPPPYTEDDKLGPLRSAQTLIVDDDAQLRRVLVAEFQAAADAAKSAAATVDRNITTAVHEYRKALRRARAVLSLVAGALPKSERRAVRRALRDARRSLGTARDHAVAADSVGLVQLDEVSQHAADAILTTAREAVPPLAEIKQLLNEGAARTAAQVEALEAALPATISWDTVLDGIRSVYADARDARKSARRSKRQFHTWRRRTKELAYQVDVIAGYTGEGLTDLQRDLEAVTDTQSPAVDLMMLRDFVRTHGGGTSAEALDGLVDSIDHQLEDLMADSRRAGRDVFRRKPRRFAKRLTKAARSEPEPAALPDDVD